MAQRGVVKAVVMVESRSAAEPKSAKAACSKGGTLTVSAHIVSAVRMSLMKLATLSPSRVARSVPGLFDALASHQVVVTTTAFSVDHMIRWDTHWSLTPIGTRDREQNSLDTRFENSVSRLIEVRPRTKHHLLSLSEPACSYDVDRLDANID